MMGFTLNVNHGMKLLHVYAHSNLYAADVDQYYKQLKATEGVHLCDKALVDLSHPDVSVKHVPLKSVKALGNMFHQAPLLPSGAKMAFAVNSSLVYGFVRLFMGSRGDDVTIRPFKNRADALAWLEVAETDLPEPLNPDI